jgi:hypothetical protein
MTLKELKKYVNTIPEKMDDYNVVNGEFGVAKDNETFVMTNNEVLTIYIDLKNEEVQFLHQTDEDVKNILLDGDTDTE